MIYKLLKNNFRISLKNKSINKFNIFIRIKQNDFKIKIFLYNFKVAKQFKI
jgi:hypothetical protein